MRFVFIEAQKAYYRIRILCRVMQVSHSGFYAWRKRPECARRVQDRKLLTLVRRFHHASKRRYGSPRVHRDVLAHGVHVGRHRIARLMREDGLCGRRRRRFRVTTQSKHRHPVAANVLQRQFSPSQPNTAWASDLTYSVPSP